MVTNHDPGDEHCEPRKPWLFFGGEAFPMPTNDDDIAFVYIGTGEDAATYMVEELPAVVRATLQDAAGIPRRVAGDWHTVR